MICLIVDTTPLLRYTSLKQYIRHSFQLLELMMYGIRTHHNVLRTWLLVDEQTLHHPIHHMDMYIFSYLACHVGDQVISIFSLLLHSKIVFDILGLQLCKDFIDHSIF